MMKTRREKIMDGFAELERSMPTFGLSSLPLKFLREMVEAELKELDKKLEEKNV